MEDEPDQPPQTADSLTDVHPDTEELPAPLPMDLSEDDVPAREEAEPSDSADPDAASDDHAAAGALAGAEGDAVPPVDATEALEHGLEAPAPVDGVADADASLGEVGPFAEATKEPEEEDSGGPDTQEIEIPEMPLTQRAQTPSETLSPVWIWWGWSMVGLFSLVVVVGVVTGILGRAVLLDIVSFWPVFVVLTLVAIAVRSRFSHRIRAALPLLIATWIGAAVALHLASWSVLPSAVGDMAGAETGEIVHAALSLEIDGILNLEGAPQSVLYSVLLPREGGRVSAPQALETTSDDGMSIELAQRNESFWFSSSGWDVAVSDDVVWSLHLVAREANVDLRSIATAGGVLQAAGTLQLSSSATGEWEVTGDLLIRVPETVGILVIGEADLPTGWTVTELGRQWGDSVSLTLVVTGGSAVEIVTY